MSDKHYTAPTDEQIEDEITELLWRLDYFGVSAGRTRDEVQAHRNNMARRIAEQLPYRIIRMIEARAAEAGA